MNVIKNKLLLSILMVASTTQTTFCTQDDHNSVIAYLLNLIGMNNEVCADEENVNQNCDGIVNYVKSRDFAAVKAMFADSWMWLGMDDSQDVAFIDYMYQDYSRCLKVLRVDGKTVGFIMFYFSGYISFLVVDASYRKHGYARQLLQFAIDEILKHGVHEISLCAHKDNATALAFYENKFGFKIQMPEYLSLVLHVASHQ